jgi:hypothetical protein
VTKVTSNSTGWLEIYNRRYYHHAVPSFDDDILNRDYSAGKEIITRFTVDKFFNKGVFYTDSNGREQIKRVLNTRSDYSYDVKDEPISSNYYPVTSRIVIKDEARNLEVAVLNDRAQGGTSLSDGVIELMVHRRLVRDDGYGVGEALREQEYGKGLYARGQHYLVFGPANSIGQYGNWCGRCDSLL